MNGLKGIIDGHAHIHAGKKRRRSLLHSLSFIHTEPAASVGAGTAADLFSRMEASHIDYTVLASFTPVKSVERSNEWTLPVSREHSGLIPLISV